MQWKFAESETPGLFKLIELEQFPAEKLRVKADIGMTRGLKPEVKDRILNKAVYL